MIEYLSQFTANDLVMIHCAVILMTVLAIMSVSLICWLTIIAYEILIVTWWEAKSKRDRAISLFSHSKKVNGIYTVTK